MITALLLRCTVAEGPCDIYAEGKTPCVAAHSMTRALFAAYDGALYNVKRSSDDASLDVGVEHAGGVADAAAQLAFCKGSAVVCVVQRIYDQSPMANHIGIEHGAPNLLPPRNNRDVGVNFADPRASTTLNGQLVYAAFFPGDPGENKSHAFRAAGYSNRTARGTAVGDEPQSMYAIFAGGKDSEGEPGGCCFDYGNAENVTHDGKAGPMIDGAMEAIFWSGRKLGADLENGIYGMAEWVRRWRTARVGARSSSSPTAPELASSHSPPLSLALSLARSLSFARARANRAPPISSPRSSKGSAIASPFARATRSARAARCRRCTTARGRRATR
jgi:hypothetical protein